MHERADFEHHGSLISMPNRSGRRKKGLQEDGILWIIFFKGQ